MSLRMYDYRCGACGREWEDLVDVAPGEGETAICGACGGEGRRFWKKAPGMFGEENVDAETMRAARSGVTYGTGNQPVPPFRGTTRSELRRWMRENNLASASRSEINSRSVVPNTKTKFTDTPAFRRLHEKTLRAAMEIARSEDAVAERLAKIERPNDFDEHAFTAQTEGGISAIAANEQTKSAAALVAEELGAS